MKGQLLKEIAALTAFGHDRTRDAEDDLYDDGTSALPGAHPGDGEGVGAGEWRVEGGKAQEAGPAVRSKLRMAAGMAALESEVRYKGKKASRAALGFVGGEEESEEEEEGSSSGDDYEEMDEQDEEENESGSGSGSESEEEEEGDDDDDDDDDNDLARLRQDKQGMALLLKRSRDEQWARAEAAKRHRDLWNRLLEVRILLQRLLGMGNRLPRGEAYEGYCRADPAVGEGMDGAASVLRGVLSQLVGLRRRQAAELEEEDGEEDGDGDGGATTKKRRRVASSDVGGGDFTGPLGGRDDPWAATRGDYEACKAHWRRVLDAAHQRATLSVAVGAGKKFRVVNQGLWHQVEAGLADRGRALRKSHLTRGQARAAGLFVGGGGGDRGGDGDHEDEEPDEEAFDDAELYQLLLRDYIQSVGPGGGVDGAAADALAGRGGLNRRSKRRGVDTKASKGRKLRYAVHPKLEHFMFPVPPPPAPMDVDRLFASLPGSRLGAGARNAVVPAAVTVGGSDGE